jgi:acyl carrier protein
MNLSANVDPEVDPDMLLTIKRLFRQLLHLDDMVIDSAATFFALGGTSLHAVALVACLQAQFDVDFSAASLLDHSTPAAIARYVGILRATVSEQEEEEGML